MLQQCASSTVQILLSVVESVLELGNHELSGAKLSVTRAPNAAGDANTAPEATPDSADATPAPPTNAVLVQVSRAFSEQTKQSKKNDRSVQIFVSSSGREQEVHSADFVLAKEAGALGFSQGLAKLCAASSRYRVLFPSSALVSTVFTAVSTESYLSPVISVRL